MLEKLIKKIHFIALYKKFHFDNIDNQIKLYRLWIYVKL